MSYASNHVVINTAEEFFSILQAYRTSFPYSKPYKDIPAIILINQLYAATFNRTLVDAEIDKLRHDNTIRLFRLSSGISDYAICFTDDYRSVVKTLYFHLINYNQINQRKNKKHNIMNILPPTAALPAANINANQPETRSNQAQKEQKSSNSSAVSQQPIKRRKLTKAKEEAVKQEQIKQEDSIKQEIVKSEPISEESFVKSEPIGQDMNPRINEAINPQQETQPKVEIQVQPGSTEQSQEVTDFLFNPVYFGHAEERKHVPTTHSSQYTALSTNSGSSSSNNSNNQPHNQSTSHNNQVLSNPSSSKANPDDLIVELPASHPIVQLETFESQRYKRAEKAVDILSDENLIVYHFIYDCLAEFFDISITKELLLQLVYEKFIEDYNNIVPADTVISTLMQRGLIYARSADSYWLAFPGSGTLIAEIVAARKEITGIIKQNKYHEMLLGKLLGKVRLKSSERGVKFHVEEMIGANKLQTLQTTMGTLVKLHKA
jgi:hypothetical protein